MKTQPIILIICHTISANGEREIGELIAKAMERVGKECVITIQDGKTLYNELEVVEGMKLDRGYISPHFITNQKNKKCELDDPIILIHEKKISNITSVINVLELALLALKKQRSLLIVAEDVESEALATLILNKLRAGVKVCAIKAPGFGENRKANMQDLATLTGGQAFVRAPVQLCRLINMGSTTAIRFIRYRLTTMGTQMLFLIKWVRFILSVGARNVVIRDRR